MSFSRLNLPPPRGQTNSHTTAAASESGYVWLPRKLLNTENAPIKCPSIIISWGLNPKSYELDFIGHVNLRSTPASLALRIEKRCARELFLICIIRFRNAMFGNPAVSFRVLHISNIDWVLLHGSFADLGRTGTCICSLLRGLKSLGLGWVSMNLTEATGSCISNHLPY